jgi:hypothetical protein
MCNLSAQMLSYEREECGMTRKRKLHRPAESGLLTVCRGSRHYTEMQMRKEG